MDALEPGLLCVVWLSKARGSFGFTKPVTQAPSRGGEGIGSIGWIEISTQCFKSADALIRVVVKNGRLCLREMQWNDMAGVNGVLAFGKKFNPAMGIFRGRRA